MTQVTDRRAVELFWELLADEEATVSVAYALERSLRKVYYGEAIYNSQSKAAQMPLRRREVAEVAKPRATAGSEWQRVVGLALLLGAAPGEAVEPARQMSDDPKLSEPLRNDAFQVLLAAQPKTERMKTAIAALSSDQSARRKLVLTYLVQGSSVLRYLRGRIPLWFDGSNDGGITYSGGQPIIPEPPPGLEAEHVRPLVADSDPEVAAYAGYLLALFGDAAGLDKLLGYWPCRKTNLSATSLIGWCTGQLPCWTIRRRSPRWRRSTREWRSMKSAISIGPSAS